MRHEDYVKKIYSKTIDIFKGNFVSKRRFLKKFAKNLKTDRFLR